MKPSPPQAIIAVSILAGVAAVALFQPGPASKPVASTPDSRPPDDSSSSSATSGHPRRTPPQNDAEIARILRRISTSLEAGEDPGNVFGEFLNSWQGSPQQFRELAEGILKITTPDSPERGNLTRSLLSMMANRHPHEVMDFMLSLAPAFGTSESSKLTGFTGEILYYVAVTDCHYASDWLAAHAAVLSSSEAERASREVITAAAGQNADFAISLLSTLPLQKREAGLIYITQGVNTAEGRTAILDLARHLDAPDAAAITKSVLSSIGSGLGGLRAAPGAMGKPCFASSLDWLEQAQLSPAELQTVARSLMSATNPSDNPGWLAWLGKTELSSRDVNSVTDRIVGAWSARDPAGVEAWIAASDPGPIHEAAIAVFVKNLLRSDPAAALRVSKLSANEELRQSPPAGKPGE